MTINDFDLETFVAYRRLLDMSGGIVDKEKFYETAKEFVDAYENNKRGFELSSFGEQVREVPNSKKPTAIAREIPEVAETYRDIFGKKYFVAAVMPKVLSDGTTFDDQLVVLACVDLQTVYTLPLEEFLNPKFVKE